MAEKSTLLKIAVISNMNNEEKIIISSTVNTNPLTVRCEGIKPCKKGICHSRVIGVEIARSIKLISGRDKKNEAGIRIHSTKRTGRKKCVRIEIKSSRKTRRIKMTTTSLSI
jgi:hypothetical protein